jgi:hypothetical protein
MVHELYSGVDFLCSLFFFSSFFIIPGYKPRLGITRHSSVRGRRRMVGVGCSGCALERTVIVFLGQLWGHAVKSIGRCIVLRDGAEQVAQYGL